METKFNFTIEKIAKLTCPADKKQTRYMDTKVDGLGLRVTPAGSKMFIYYRYLPKDNESPFKVCELRLGKTDGMTIEQARSKAKELNAVVENKKKDPSRKDEDKLTYGMLFDRYLNEYAKTRTATWQSAIYNHERYFKRWHNCPLSQITRQKVQNWVNDTGDEFGKYAANRTYNTMRAVFSWALRKNIIDGDNPCIGVDTFKARARERFILPGDEFEKFANELNKYPNDSVRDFFWMCLFTGARRANVLAMEWNQIDFDMQVWRIPITKNQESLTVPLTTAAIELLQSRKKRKTVHERWVFPSDRVGKKTGELGHLVSPHKAWAGIIDRAGIKDLRIHDLRRTAGSYMAIEGISPTIIGKALGHKSPQATAIYTRLTQDPVRQALEKAHESLTRRKPKATRTRAAKTTKSSASSKARTSKRRSATK